MKISTIYGLLLTLVLAGFPAVAAIALVLDVSSTPISIAMRALMVALGSVLLVLALLGRHSGFPRHWFWVPLAIFWAAYLARMFYSTTVEAYLLARPPQDYWIWAIGSCLAPMLGLVTRINERAWPLAYRHSMLLMLVAAVIVVRYGGTMVSVAGNVSYDSGRLRLESLNPISVGHLGGSLLLLSLWGMMKATSVHRWLRWGGFGTSAAIGVYLVVAAASRGPMLTVILVLLFYAVALNARRVWKLTALLTLVLGAGYYMAMYFQDTGQFSTLSRVEGAYAGNDGAVEAREQSYAGAIRQFADSPLVGDGLEERSTGFYPHNVILESFMATGIVGGISFVLLVVYGAIASYRILRTQSPQGWVSMIYLQYLIAAQFSGAIYSSGTFWAFLGAVISLWLTCQKRILQPERNPFVGTSDAT